MSKYRNHFYLIGYTFWRNILRANKQKHNRVKINKKRKKEKIVLNRKEPFLYVVKRHLFILIFLALTTTTVYLLPVFSAAANSDKPAIHFDTTGVFPSYLSDTTVEEGESEIVGTILTETTPVDPSYFLDTIFAGDSLTEGFGYYDFLQDYKTIFARGISPHSAMTHAFYYAPNGEVMTMYDAILYFKPRKLYIMLGTNGINVSTAEELMNGYSTFIYSLKANAPDMHIVLQSLPPVTLETSLSNPVYYSLENIDKYNQMIKELALSSGCYFLDTNSIYRDSTGFLPEHIAAYDGIHFNPEGYQMWYDFLLSHTIQGDSPFSIGPDGKLILSTNIPTEPETTEPVPTEPTPTPEPTPAPTVEPTPAPAEPTPAPTA